MVRKNHNLETAVMSSLWLGIVGIERLGFRNPFQYLAKFCGKTYSPLYLDDT